MIQETMQNNGSLPDYLDVYFVYMQRQNQCNPEHELHTGWFDSTPGSNVNPRSGFSYRTRDHTGYTSLTRRSLRIRRDKKDLQSESVVCKKCKKYMHLAEDYENQPQGHRRGSTRVLWVGKCRALFLLSISRLLGLVWWPSMPLNYTKSGVLVSRHEVWRLKHHTTDVMTSNVCVTREPVLLEQTNGCERVFGRVLLVERTWNILGSSSEVFFNIFWCHRQDIVNLSPVIPSYMKSLRRKRRENELVPPVNHNFLRRRTAVSWSLTRHAERIVNRLILFSCPSRKSSATQGRRQSCSQGFPNPMLALFTGTKSFSRIDLRHSRESATLP